MEHAPEIALSVIASHSQVKIEGMGVNILAMPYCQEQFTQRARTGQERQTKTPVISKVGMLMPFLIYFPNIIL